MPREKLLFLRNFHDATSLKSSFCERQPFMASPVRKLCFVESDSISLKALESTLDFDEL